MVQTMYRGETICFSTSSGHTIAVLSVRLAFVFRIRYLEKREKRPPGDEAMVYAVNCGSKLRTSACHRSLPRRKKVAREIKTRKKHRLETSHFSGGCR